MEKQDFSQRLSMLRIQKGVSARDMSLSLGQSNSYINNIENGLNFPSMSQFFAICDYLSVTPAEFFDVDIHASPMINELISVAKKLKPSQIETLTSLARELAK